MRIRDRLLLLAYVLLALLYVPAAPMFEAPDENYHFAFAGRLSQSWALPVQDAAVETPWYQEGSQPPLYYFLVSILFRVANVPPEHALFQLPINPHAQIGIGLAQINQNFFLHRGIGTDVPVSIGTAFLLARALSVLLGAWTLFALYSAIRLALPDSEPVLVSLALGFAAFNPQFLFMTSSINNDNLVVALSATACWLVMILIRQGYSGRVAGLLALVMALAALSKLSGLTLYGLAFAALAALWLKKRLTLRQGLIALAACAGAFALIAGWWYVRNLTLYGDLTGTNRMIAIIGARKTPFTLNDFLTEMEGLRISFWALFGWFNVIGHAWFLIVMDALTVVALIGGIAGVRRIIRAGRHDDLLALGLLGLHFVITFAAWANWTRQTPGTQGRLLFPAMTALAALAALGWWTAAGWLGRYRRHIAWLPAAILGLEAVLSPYFVIGAAYAAPPGYQDSLDRSPDCAAGFCLSNAWIDSAPIRPGENLRVTLVYFAGEAISRNLSIYLTALDRDGSVIGKIDTYPGGGDLPTTALEPGLFHADRYDIPIRADARGPMQFQVEFGVWDYATGERFTTAPVILRGGSLLGDPPATPAVRQQAVFADALRLNGFRVTQAGRHITVSIQWEALAKVTEDYNVLVHLVAVQGDPTPVAQGDSAPLGGHYPTSAWAVGHPFEDVYQVDAGTVSPGEYRVLIGLYRLRDFARLPVGGGGDALALETTIRLE